MTATPLALLARLWLNEPSADTLRHAGNDLRLPTPDLPSLAEAYSALFLLNVPPYRSVFFGYGAELNDDTSQWVVSLFDSLGYAPPELHLAGAPDHAGLCLGALGAAHESSHSLTDQLALDLLNWLPTCTLAVERDPTAHDFYRALASLTRRALFDLAALRGLSPQRASLPLNITDREGDDEVRLHHLLRFFLAPARCGFYLSRARLGSLALALDLRLPFATRFEVAEMLFTAAGEADRFDSLLDLLEGECVEWAAAYTRWADESPSWRDNLPLWLGRIQTARSTLAEMRRLWRADRQAG